MALTRITEGVIKPNENYVVNNINSSGVTTSTNFKTGTSNLHNVGIEIAGINVLGADTPIGTGATIYDAGGALFTGVVTATSFSGSGNIGGVDGNFSGNVTGVDATFSGNVSVGGTLTYEDVTNIDSVGLITARGGITLSGGNISLADRPDGNSHNLFFGTGARAAAYHDGTNFTVINNTGHTYIGVGAANKDLMLYAQSTGNIILQRNTGHKYFEGVGSDGTAKIYHNTNEKIRTTNTGAVVTGILTATSFKGDGSALTGLNSDKIIEGNSYAEVLDTGTNGIFRFLPEGTEKFRITTDGKVGIGTNNPLSYLDVRDPSGSDPTMSIHHSNADVEGEIIRIGRTDIPTIRYHSIKAKHGGASTANHIAVNLHNGSSTTSQTEVLRILGNGKIGIGTNNPSQLLHLAADSAHQILLKRGGGSPSEVAFKNSGNYAVISNNTNGIDLQTGSTPTSSMHIDQNGKVGIGTDNPAYFISIENATPYIRVKDTAAPTDEKTWDFNAGTDGILRFRNTNDAANSSNNWLEVERDGVATDSIRLLTGSGSERLRITSDGQLIYKTNKNSGYIAEFHQLHADNPGTIQINSPTDNNLRPAAVHLAQAGTVKWVVGQVYNSTSDRAFHICSGTGQANSKLVVTTAGNIGINEPAPSERLQIDGDILLGGQANSGTSDYAIKFEYNNHQFAKIVGDGRDSSGYGDIDFYTSTSAGASNLTQKMTIRADGKVGMGIAVPLHNLHIKPPTASETVLKIESESGYDARLKLDTSSGGGAEARIDFEEDASIRGFISYTNNSGGTTDDMVFGTATTEKLRITSGGSVTVKSGGQLRIEDSGNSTANSTHTTGALRCNLIRSDTSNNNAYTGTYFMNVNAAGGGIKSVGIVETGLKVGDFTSNLAAAEKIKLTHTGHVEIKTDGGRLKIGAGNDLQMYHDSGGSVNHITCVNNQQLKVSCNALTVYEYTGNTIAFNVDADRKIRTNGAAATGHTGMIYIQGLSDPTASETKSNLSVRGEGGNGFACGTYEATGNYGSWIQAGYLPNFTGGSPSAIYPLILNPNGNCVCVGNYNDASTTDAGLLRVQSRHGSNFYNDCTLSLEHYNQSNAREQKWHFISASNQGTEAKSNSKFRQMAVPYQTDTNYQTWTDQIVYAHTVGHNQYCWYKFNTRASSSPDRGGSARIAITWSTRHAAGTGYGEYSFAWYDHHSTSRVECFLRKQHFMSYTGGSYYGWTSNPEVVVYSCTGGGSAAGFYLRLRGHGSHNGSTYDMGTMHNFHIIHNDNNSGGNNSFFEFVSNASGGPSDASSALSFN